MSDPSAGETDIVGEPRCGNAAFLVLICLQRIYSYSYNWYSKLHTIFDNNTTNLLRWTRRGSSDSYFVLTFSGC